MAACPIRLQQIVLYQIIFSYVRKKKNIPYWINCVVPLFCDKSNCIVCQLSHSTVTYRLVAKTIVTYCEIALYRMTTTEIILILNQSVVTTWEELQLFSICCSGCWKLPDNKTTVWILSFCTAVSIKCDFFFCCPHKCSPPMTGYKVWSRLY